MKNKLGLYMLLFFAAVQFHSHLILADEKDKPFQSSIDASVVIGTQIYNDNFLYNPGFALNVSHDYKINKRLAAGIGAGYLSMESENFIPIFLDFFAKNSKKDNSGILNFQLGYSFSGNKKAKLLDAYDMQGGMYFSAGFGRMWKLNDSFSVLGKVSYTQQFSFLEYEVYDQQEYREPVDFAMIRLTFGILIQ